MLDILFCVRDQHDLRLVLLAATICILSAMTAVVMIRQAVMSRGGPARNWMLLGGFATGFGIWATHFVAMLGYQTDFIVGYKVGLTLCSLAIVLATTITAFRLASKGPAPLRIATASLIAGSGFATMHYVGMAALQMPALVRWQSGYVALSLASAIIPLYPALMLAMSRKSRASGAAAALIITLAIVGLHFSGMTAMHLVPSRAETQSALLSPQAMSVLVSVVTFGLLSFCLISWLFARRTQSAVAASERQFSILVKGISDCAIYMLDKSGHVANWNAGAQRLKGYTSGEVIGTPLARFYTDEEREAGAPAAALSKAAEQGKFTGEGWRVRKDGSRFWAHVTIERIHDDKGAHLGFAKITRDMTQFKAAQDRIEEARLHLDTALEHMHQGLCLFDADERLVLRNRRFAELWNLPQDSCPPGSTLMDIAAMALASRDGPDVPHERRSEEHTSELQSH